MGRGIILQFFSLEIFIWIESIQYFYFEYLLYVPCVFKPYEYSIFCSFISPNFMLYVNNDVVNINFIGNNLFGDELYAKLSELKSSPEREAYILMDRINPPGLPSAMMKSDSEQAVDVILESETGIFGVFVRYALNSLNETKCLCLGSLKLMKYC